MGVSREVFQKMQRDYRSSQPAGRDRHSTMPSVGVNQAAPNRSQLAIDRPGQGAMSIGEADTREMDSTRPSDGTPAVAVRRSHSRYQGPVDFGGRITNEAPLLGEIGINRGRGSLGRRT
jgi:hypothetical protein